MAGKKIEKIDQEYYKRLGKRIKDLRIGAGYKNADFFAYDHGIGRSQYSEYERGKDMRLSTLRKLATAHGITVAELLKGLE